MKAVNVKVLRTDSDRRTVQAVIVADAVPDPLPDCGKGIDGLEDTDVFAPLSGLIVIDGSADLAIYFTDTSGVFRPV